MLALGGGRLAAGESVFAAKVSNAESWPSAGNEPNRHEQPVEYVCIINAHIARANEQSPQTGYCAWRRYLVSGEGAAAEEDLSHRLAEREACRNVVGGSGASEPLSAGMAHYRGTENAARKLGMEIRLFALKSPEELEGLFSRTADWRPEILSVFSGSWFNTHRARTSIGWRG